MASEEEKADEAAAAKCFDNIHVAAAGGNLPALRHFLRVAPERVHEKDSGLGQTPLHKAAFQGRVAAAEFLISKGAAVDAKDNEGLTPLHIAAREGNVHVEAAKLLLSKGAALDAKTNDGKTPLDVARAKGKTEMEQFLLNRPAQKPSAEHGKTSLDLSSKGKAEKEPLPMAADKTSKADKKDPSSPAGSGAAAAKHQREVSKEEAARELKKAMESGNAKVLKEAIDKAKLHAVSPEEVMEAMDKYIALRESGTTIVPDTSAVEIPTGEGTPAAMFSARFDGGPIEQKMRRVHKILVDNSYNALMVEVDAGESFGVLTARYLNKLKADKGLMIAVCTRHYGEMTDSEYCSFYELKFAVTNGIKVLPLKVEDTYPPQPPCGKDHLDKECDAQGFIGMKLGKDVLYLDCRTMSEMDIASAIATRLRQLRDERQVSRA